MKAHDVRHLRVCKACGGLGDGRKMLRLPDGHYHDACIVERMTHAQILRLPQIERNKITLGAAGIELMRKMMEANEGEA